MKKRLAIVVGHNSEKQGAVRRDTGESEFVWNSGLARLIEAYADAYPDIEVRVFFREPGMGYRREIERVYEETDRWGANVTVELHFNASGDPDVSGTETFTSGTPASMALAMDVNREMVAVLGLRDRGVKTRFGTGRGGASLISGRAPAILIEPYFGSSSKGLRATDEAHEKKRLAEAIMRGVASSLGAMPRTTAQMAESRTLKHAAAQRSKIWGAAGALAASVGLDDAHTVFDAIGIGDRLGQALPYLQVIAPIALVALLFAIRMDANKIEEARWDDHERGLR